MDPVISSKYGKRPLLEVPALRVSGDVVEVNTLQQPQDSMPPAPYYGATVPADWPYAWGFPGSLFGGLPGPLPYNYPYPLPLPQIQIPPLRLQPPQQTITDAQGNPVPAPSYRQQNLSLLYPGVHNPNPPHSVYTPRAAAGEGDGESFQLDGQLEYGVLTSVRYGDKDGTFFQRLPEFLRQELHRTYGQVPVTDVRIVARSGEYHVYATPRTPPAKDLTDKVVVINEPEQRMIGYNGPVGGIVFAGKPR